jgi:hypothetical protein
VCVFFFYLTHSLFWLFSGTMVKDTSRQDPLLTTESKVDPECLD